MTGSLLPFPEDLGIEFENGKISIVIALKTILFTFERQSPRSLTLTVLKFCRVFKTEYHACYLAVVFVFTCANPCLSITNDSYLKILQ